MLFGLLSSTANAQTAEESEIVFQPRVGVGYTTTNNEGIKDFTSFEGFLPLMQTPRKNLTFLEGKMLVNTENGALGGNSRRNTNNSALARMGDSTVRQPTIFVDNRIVKDSVADAIGY